MAWALKAVCTGSHPRGWEDCTPGGRKGNWLGASTALWTVEFRGGKFDHAEQEGKGWNTASWDARGLQVWQLICGTDLTLVDHELGKIDQR